MRPDTRHPDRARLAHHRQPHHPRRAPARRAHRRPGDPEVLQRRRRQDRARRCKPETMWSLFNQVGFGAPPHSGFPGKSPGGCAPRASWRPIEQATMSYGHGISVSLLQLARAYLIFATDGELKPADAAAPRGRRPSRTQVISPATAQAVRSMLEMAVQPGGTAPRAQVTGYRVAGKTGTAHKLEGRRLRGDKYVSSFVGFAPASAPAPGGRGDDRRAHGGPVLRRHGRGAGVQPGDGGRAAAAGGVRPMRRWTTSCCRRRTPRSQGRSVTSGSRNQEPGFGSDGADTN